MARTGRKPAPKSRLEMRVKDTENDPLRKTPIFCLAWMHRDFCLDQLGKDAKANFAVALAKRAQLTWTEINRSGRHQLGSEKIPVSELRMSLPGRFEGTEDVLAFRYHGLLPMVGVRVGETLHVLAIERHFGELYDHGS